MPGTSGGTGQPMWLRCAKCRVGRYWTGKDAMNLEATGEIKPLSPSLQGHSHGRMMNFKAEYKCLDCGHTGWSRHIDMLRLLRRKGIHVDKHGQPCSDPASEVVDGEGDTRDDQGTDCGHESQGVPDESL